MKTLYSKTLIKLFGLVIFVCLFFVSKAQPERSDKVDDLLELMQTIVDTSEEELFRMSCQSIINVINAEDELSATETSYLEAMYDEFVSGDIESSPYGFENYLNRKHSLIFAWTSETDGEISFTWLRLPDNWNAETEYPLYVQLHGLWDVAGNALNYMAYPFINGPSTNYAFENGYQLSPWGRGNHWYEGISETDIWECIAEFEKRYDVNPKRKYLCGHSMGGYGAWNLSQKTAGVWAAVGIHAGALWWNSGALVTQEIADNLSETPVYFVVGTNDGLLNVCQQAYALLENSGNPNLEFVTFVGGHEYRSEDVEGMYDWLSQFTNDNPVSKVINETITVSINVEPNPFNNIAQIKYSLKQKEQVVVTIYNSMGQQVDYMLNEHQNIGEHLVVWEPKNLPKGLYYCKLETESESVTKRIIYSE